MRLGVVQIQHDVLVDRSDGVVVGTTERVVNCLCRRSSEVMPPSIARDVVRQCQGDEVVETSWQGVPRVHRSDKDVRRRGSTRA